MGKKVIIKNNRQIQLIRDSGKYLTEILHLVKENAKPGVRLIDLENQVQRYLDFHNIKGAFKGYYGYPANLCLSVNDCVVHGIPDDYVLKEGDLLKVDCGVDYKGGISDAAFSMVIGGDDKNFQAANLYKGTKSALDEAIKVLRPGLNLIEYGKKIYSLLKNKNISVIRNLTGHGVGVKLHEAPTIFNFPEKSMKRYYLQKDMVIAIEPITAIKSKYAVEKPGKSWNMYTEYGDLGAHWEYTILITDNGYEILAGIM